MFSLCFIQCSTNTTDDVVTIDSTWVLPERSGKNHHILEICEEALVRFDSIFNWIENYSSFILIVREKGVDDFWKKSVKDYHVILNLVSGNDTLKNNFVLNYANFLDAVNYTLFCSEKNDSFTDEDSIKIWMTKGEDALEDAEEYLDKIHVLLPELQNLLSDILREDSPVEINQDLNEIQARGRILEVLDTITSLTLLIENYYYICIKIPSYQNKPPKSILLTYGYVSIASAYSDLEYDMRNWNELPGIDKELYSSFISKFADFINIFSDISVYYSSNYYRTGPLELPEDLKLRYQISLNKLLDSQTDLRYWVFGKQ